MSAPLARRGLQLIIQRNPDLPGITELQESLVRIIRRDQAKVKSLLRIARIEEIADPEARRQAAAPYAHAQVFEIVGARGLRIAGVVVEAAQRGSVQAREPAARVVILGRRRELVAGRERL